MKISLLLREVASILYQFTGFIVLMCALILLAIIYTFAYFIVVYGMLLFGKAMKLSLKEYLRPLYDIYVYIVNTFFGE